MSVQMLPSMITVSNNDQVMQQAFPGIKCIAFSYTLSASPRQEHGQHSTWTIELASGGTVTLI
jgi:hypothetical protein